jgi:hypothetical protein
MNKRKKARIFFGLILLMVTYIGWSFYISEPKYIDGISSKKIETFDWVSIPDRTFSWDKNSDVRMGIVLQVDGDRALIKSEGRYSCSNEEMKDIIISEGKHRIVGRGTIYHKVNHYVGFNIMMISQVLIGILLLIILFTQVSILNDLLS